jgi:hypothetical protein
MTKAKKEIKGEITTLPKSTGLFDLFDGAVQTQNFAMAKKYGTITRYKGKTFDYEINTLAMTQEEARKDIRDSITLLKKIDEHGY